MLIPLMVVVEVVGYMAVEEPSKLVVEEDPATFQVAVVLLAITMVLERWS